MRGGKERGKERQKEGNLNVTAKEKREMVAERKG